VVESVGDIVGANDERVVFGLVAHLTQFVECIEMVLERGIIDGCDRVPAGARDGRGRG
jgi:hypothetical protein